MNTANTLRNIAILQEEECDEPAAAMASYEAALAIYERVLGEHTSTASTLYNMATVAKDRLGRAAEATTGPALLPGARE